MRRLFLTSVTLLTAIALLSPPAQAATWQLDPSHSTVGFKVRHLFSKVTGNFATYEGTIEFDPQDPTQTQATVNVSAASIDTGNEQRDKHLRSGDFFDVETYPTIDFTSTGVMKEDDQWVLRGDLTIHGVTKPVALEFDFLGAGADPWGGQRAGFTATTKIDRKEFGIVWNKALDSGGFVLGDKVEIEIEIEAIAATTGR